MNPPNMFEDTSQFAEARNHAPRAVIFYHYLPPDEVVSAILFGELAAGLSERGWSVRAYASNRAFRDGSPGYPPRDIWMGVKIRRLWRPAFKQSSFLGRILNSLWMVTRWSALAFDPLVNPDVLIMGTDPILSVFVAPIWRRFKPHTRIAHWCFDLYPEAAIADGLLKSRSRFVLLLRRLLKKAYGACDLIVDIGSCMHERLQIYGAPGRVATIAPWALEQPAAPALMHNPEREAIFPNAGLALMYSGSFGRAHSFDHILLLARRMLADNVRLAFSVSGNCEQELRHAVLPEDVNIKFVPFAEPEKLSTRLSAADVHVVSLREEWTGTVVPSKFFGALAVGRPVLFAGSPESAVARWIEEHKVGWVLTPDTIGSVVDELRKLIADPEAKQRLNHHCFRVYCENFARQIGIDRWDAELQELLQRPRSASESSQESDLSPDGVYSLKE
jgi:glycosyltransferase involved in cell wall biosynthesis